MHSRCSGIRVAIVIVVLVAAAMAESFVVFPQTGQLVSPDGRFVVRNVDREAGATEFVGTFHALWMIEVATGRSRKLCDYLGVAAVAWSSQNYLMVTQYVGKKNSRALIFLPATEDAVMLDSSTLIQMVPVEMRATLRENDHVFIEASKIEGETFAFRVWGYGKRDGNGFRWNCEYGLRGGAVVCRATP